MQLFKRILLSLFPDEMMSNNLNPAGMFISFISSKEFFSVINRKIVENYKLNLFDIAIDPFEFKIGFGKNNNIKPKEIDLYYGYCGTANINGYRFLNPSNMANCITLVVADKVKDIFRKYPEQYFVNFLYTIYLLSFVYLARIKIFPHKNKEKNYNWLIDNMFSFYEFVFQQTSQTPSQQHIKEIKKQVVGQVDLFFFLFEYYQILNNLLYNPKIASGEFYEWMFYDEIKSATTKPLFTSFMEQHEEYTTKSEFSVVEKKILHYILPADILIKYLFIDADPFLITDNIITNVYEKENIENFLKAFSKGKGDFKGFINYLTDYRNFKKNFFKGVQKYLVHIFREEVKGKEDMDDLMSEIGENIENSESFKVPERIKKESKIMEKILNFYITLIGGLRISRGDDFSLRLYNKKMINEILDQTNFLEDKKDSIYYYGSLLYSYGKNVFYYRYASENIRSGKQKFYLPYQSDSKKIYSNMYIVKLFDENFLCTILQDFNVKDVKIYVKNQKILDIFKKLFGKEISLYVKENTDELIENVYGELGKSLEEIKNFTKIIKKNIDEQDIYHLKDNMYSLDFWLAQSLYSQIQKSSIIQQYSDQTLLGILANCRDTLLGFLVYIKYIEQKNTDGKIKTELLWKIYCNDILNVRDPAQEEIKEIGKLMLKEFDEILTHWIEIDDNKAFFQIGLDNWIEISKHLVDNKHYLSGDDIIRFKGYLKNITYYNKRFLIPK